jgi:exosortase
MVRRSQVFIAWTAVVGLLSWSLLYDLIKRSLEQGYSSQIILVPFISAYLIWHERQKIFSELEYSPMPALLLVMAGLVAYAGRLYPAPFDFFTSPALRLTGTFLMISGAFLGLYGVRAFKAGLFPFILLLLMIPLPPVVIDRVIGFLQAQSTALSYHLFAFIGVPVYRDGFRLSLPGVTIEVAKECSGINSSVALLLTALLAAWQTLRTPSRRTILLLLTVPLSILKNAVRIVTLTMLALYVDPSFLTGKLHHEGGFVFFLIALALFYPMLLLLQKTEPMPLAVVLDPESLTSGMLPNQLSPSPPAASGPPPAHS